MSPNPRQLDYELRSVRLPIENLGQCAACHSEKTATSTLRLCSSCLQCAYCSLDCQKSDWPNHKGACKLTDCIELSTFYPLLACLASSAHVHSDKPMNPAINHTILNSPNPGPSSSFSSSIAPGNLIMLGPEIPMTEWGSPKWWPTALSPKVRSKLFRRLSSEGYNLQNLTAVCVALLAEMYTTTARVGERRRILRYRSSPIADFGIVRGAVEVQPQDTFSYMHLSDDGTPPRSWNGPDPKDHYWLYFRTTRGEEVTLDFAMYYYNFCYMVDSEPYQEPCSPPLSFVSAFFCDRPLDRNAPSLYTEKGRISVLRNTVLHDAVAHTLHGLRPANSNAIIEFMEGFSGKRSSAIERDLTLKWLMVNFQQLESALRRQSWKRYPAQPPVGIEGDPGELDLSRMDNDDEWLQFFRRWKKQHKKSKPTKEDVAEAFKAWRSERKL
ncbi:hypothetical protein HGRIS_006412 [Hohenbuehelia grisea]|uniref:MYND-type domain-containing protein n=1 Tax=Hohenbuehelia grisea TaxID=104357 RepID=A0ABR3K2S4_9AGAR